LNITEAVNIVTQTYAFEPWDEHTRTAMSELFKGIIPGNYEIDWEMDEHNMPQVKLKFEDEAESIIWLLKHS
jgi:hypothetical protein